MCLCNDLCCLCLGDARRIDIKPNRELKSWQRISLPIRVVCGLLVDLTECDISRYLDITELFVLLVSHKTNCTGETCRVPGSKQLLGIRCTGFAWSTHFTRYTQIELHNAIRTFNVSVPSTSGGCHVRIYRLVFHSFFLVDVFLGSRNSVFGWTLLGPKNFFILCGRFSIPFANARNVGSV